LIEEVKLRSLEDVKYELPPNVSNQTQVLKSAIESDKKIINDLDLKVE
jgi:hypothetical protein